MTPKLRAWKKYDSPEMFRDIAFIDFNKKLLGVNYKVSKLTTRLDIETLDKCILMQSTGLKDKNGTEIFEGDIVRYTWDLPNDINATEKGKKIRVDKVFWSDWRVSFALGKNSLNSDLFRYVRNGNTVEVIGNIYENPELSEGAAR